MKKILILRSSLGIFGAERLILELAKELNQSEFRPVIGVLENSHGSCFDMAEKAGTMGLQTRIFKCRYQFDPLTANQIRKYTKDNGIRLINSHGYKADFYAWVSTRFTNVGCVATCHPWLETDISLRAKFYTLLDHHILKRFFRIVAISNEMRDEILKTGLSLDKVFVVENGIDISQYLDPVDVTSVKKDLDIPVDGLIIGAVGRLSPEKGHQILLKAAEPLLKSNRRMYVVIIGDGDLRDELEKMCADSGIQPFVRFTGIRVDIPTLLAAFDIFVMPSLTEGMPMALLEAMAAAKPVISTSVGSIPQVIEQNHSGILVPPGNIHALTIALEGVLADLSSAQEFGQNARERISKYYSASLKAREYIEIYKQYFRLVN